MNVFFSKVWPVYLSPGSAAFCQFFVITAFLYRHSYPSSLRVGPGVRSPMQCGRSLYCLYDAPVSRGL